MYKPKKKIPVGTSKVEIKQHVEIALKKRKVTFKAFTGNTNLDVGGSIIVQSTSCRTGLETQSCV